jgi:hypothetical protein
VVQTHSRVHRSGVFSQWSGVCCCAWNDASPPSVLVWTDQGSLRYSVAALAAVCKTPLPPGPHPLKLIGIWRFPMVAASRFLSQADWVNRIFIVPCYRLAVTVIHQDETSLTAKTRQRAWFGLQSGGADKTNAAVPESLAKTNPTPGRASSAHTHLFVDYF